jgi:hypothetical protein
MAQDVGCRPGAGLSALGVGQAQATIAHQPGAVNEPSSLERWQRGCLDSP